MVVVRQKAWPAAGWNEAGAGQGWHPRSLVAVGAVDWNWPMGHVCQVRHTVSVEPAQAAKRKVPAEQLLQGTQRLGLLAVIKLAGQVVTQTEPSRKVVALQDKQVVLVPAQVAQLVLQSRHWPPLEKRPGVQLAVQVPSAAEKMRPVGQERQLVLRGPEHVRQVGKQGAHEGLDWPPQVPVR